MVMKSTGIILAFDPGKHCGWASFDAARTLYHAEIIDGQEALLKLFVVQRTLRLKAVVIENYIGGGRMDFNGRYTLMLVGRLLGACEALGVPTALQSPQAKDPCLAEAEAILAKSHTKHASDDVAALAHLIAYQERTKP